MKKILLLGIILAVLSAQSSFATDVYEVPKVNPTFEFSIYNQDETLYDDEGTPSTSAYTLTENQRDALFDAAVSWDEIFNTLVDPSKLPNFAVTTTDELNAFASSGYVAIEGSDYLVTEINAFVNGRTLKEKASEYNGNIVVGTGLIKDYPGWNFYDGSTALYQADGPDLYSTMAHEMYHAIGLITFATQHVQGDKTIYFSKDASSPITIWDAGLRIYKNPLTAPFDSSKILASAPGMSVKIDKNGNETFDIVNYAPYFAGIETLKVLTGIDDTEENMQAYILSRGGLKHYSHYYEDDATLPRVLGLPVNVIEEGKAELSHIELRNSFMSHQDYQNWAILMEAELAVLKDLGYTNVEPRRYFGKSYYLDNNGTQYSPVIFSTGYGEWDKNISDYTPGSYSTVVNGVGLHIYSDNNYITQNCDTLSKGKYAIGTRIDGVNNTYTLNNSLIDLKGDESIGLAVAWGKDHTVTIDSTSNVTASGKDSIGVSFDFGKNVMGGLSTDEGSYSMYEHDSDKNVTPDVETQGALVDTLNVDGKIKGTKAAIYISENAHVDKININDGSSIDGNIISKWNSVKSGINMSVQRKGIDGKWYPVDKDKIEEIYFTDLNFSGNTDVTGNIDGSNDIFNTLKVKNTGILDFRGSDMNIYDLNNTGTINFLNAGAPEIAIQDGYIKGDGTLNFQNGVNLATIRNIENIVNVGNDKFLSLADGASNVIDIDQLNAKNVDLYIDYGDSFILQNASNSGFDKLNLKHVAVDQAHADAIEEADSVKLFEATSPTAITTNTLDVSSSSNFYYKGNKYTLSQNPSDKTKLSIAKTAGSFELSDAIGDSTTANYIISENDNITKDLGTIQSDIFEISGDDIDVNGHSGLVVDGTLNQKTILKTDIYGASDSNITLINNANMMVEDEDGINIGKNGETSLTIDNSSFEAGSENDNIDFGGAIKGLNTNTKNIVILSANEVNLDSVDNVSIATKSETTNLKNTMTDTIWQVEGKNINVLKDSYLSSDGTNELVINKGALSFINDKASDINLKSMTLNSDLDTSIDVDLDALQADSFAFINTGDLATNGHDLYIKEVNFLNQDVALTDANYEIPFISSGYKNTNLLRHTYLSDSQDIMTPIFKYNFAYKETPTQGNWSLSRGSSLDYRSYNPSVLAGPTAAQVGGYLTQLNSYNEAFYNMDMYMLMTQEQRQALKLKNKYAAADGGLLYDSSIARQERAEGWFRPYANFEKVGLKNGPDVESQAYGSYLGSESRIYDLGHGWDGMWGVYVGYNGSHQNYDGVSIYQNGGTLGLTGMAHKGNFFTGLTVNSGANSGRANTMYGNDDFAMLMAGVASKTGYNFEFAKSKFIIQPSWLMSYSFVNTFDYTNAAGVRISSSPLNAIQLQPELKFIGNLKNGWQPYASVAMIWNIMDNTKFKANDVALPEMSVKPYVKYGVGIRKTWGERFTGFFQTYITNGGRNGVGLSAGFTWTLGGNGKQKK